MKIEQIVERITKIVVWYVKTKPNETQIVELIDKMDELSGLLWMFADYTADAKGEYNTRYFTRKIDVAKEKMNLIKSGLAVNKAEIEAMLSGELAYQIEQEAEAICYKADLLLRQGNRVTEAMRTRISYYKAEKHQQQ